MQNNSCDATMNSMGCLCTWEDITLISTATSTVGIGSHSNPIRLRRSSQAFLTGKRVLYIFWSSPPQIQAEMGGLCKQNVVDAPSNAQLWGIQFRAGRLHETNRKNVMESYVWRCMGKERGERGGLGKNRTWHEDGATVDGNDRSDGHPVLAGTPSQGEERGTVESDQPHTFAGLQPNECQVQSDGGRRRQTDRLWDELRNLGSEPQGRDDQEQDPLDEHRRECRLVRDVASPMVPDQ